MEKFEGFILGILFMGFIWLTTCLVNYYDIPYRFKVDIVNHGCAEYITKNGESIWQWKPKQDGES